MEITLYSFNKRNNSTKRPTGGTVVSGEIKETTSILTPTISFGAVQPAYNYAFIPSFSRYYWIRDWTYNKGLWEASMEVDVLSSWKDVIGASSQFVIRSSNRFNGEIIDSMYPATNIPVIETVTATSPWDPANITYIVGIIAANSRGGAVTYYGMTPAQFEAFSSYLLGDTGYLGTDFTSMTIDELKVQFNPIQYVASVTAVPFNVGTFSTHPIPFGWWSLDVTALYIGADMSFQLSFNVPQHPQAERGVYLNGPPYSTYTLFMPQFGQIPLDANAVAASSTVICEVRYDVRSNTAILRVFAGNTLLYTNSSPFGAGVQVGQFAQAQGSEVTGVLDVISSAGGIFFKNPLDFAGNISDVVKGANDAIGSMFPQMATSGTNGTLAAFNDPPSLTAKFMKITSDDNSNIGRPLYEQTTISSIPGYVQTFNADISAPATAEEIGAIESTLNGGIFYE